MALISQADLEARIGRSLTSEESTDFSVINSELQSNVERKIGSSVEEATATTKVYDGGVQHLKINPCTDITAVKLLDDDLDAVYTYDTSDYQTEPANQTLKTMIRHRVGFMTGINNIQVTAKFSTYGDTDVTNIIKGAMLDFLSSEISASGNIKKESIEGYSIEYASTESKNALDKLNYLFPEV